MKLKGFNKVENFLVFFLLRIVLCKNSDKSIDWYNKAKSHSNQIENLWSCSEPKPELVYISHQNYSEYTYIPRATILHRCSDRSGCCQHTDRSCQPIQVKNVTLFFIVKKFNRRPNVECIQMVNHTKCDCLETSFSDQDYKSDDMPKNISCDSHFDLDGIQPPELINENIENVANQKN